MNEIIELTNPMSRHAAACGTPEQGCSSGVTGVALNGGGQVVATRRFAPGQDRDAMLAEMVQVLKSDLKPIPARYNAIYFEVYITDRVAVDFESTRKHGAPLGFAEYEPQSDQLDFEQVSAFGADYGYPLSEDLFLGESLDVSDVDTWSTRKILRCLDRLMEEHGFIEGHSLMAPLDDYGYDMRRSKNAMVRTELQRHARVSDRIFTRIFALCATLKARDDFGRITEFEMDFAMNCDDINPEHHRGLPGWLSQQWQDVLANFRDDD